MVLVELGNKIANAIKLMPTVINDVVVDDMLKEIGNALVIADVNVLLVAKLKVDIKKRINLNEIAVGFNKRKIIKQAVFDALINLLDPGIKPFKPIKGKSNILMFVGLQGAGKTTTVTKLAYYYKKQNYTTAMVCADTFRAGAFEQMAQNAAKANIPFYGSKTETDPVKVAQDGVETFKNEGTEIIIVDTSGRHKQENALFEEMQQIFSVVKPDNVIFVMDSSIGQAAYDQAMAFKSAIKVGSVIISKMDGHAKGGGALSAVATTQSPIIFLGTGEKIPQLELFDAKSFVSRLLGMGDIPGMMKLLEEVMPTNQRDANKRFQQGKFTLRDMYDQYQNITKMGPLDEVLQMMPGFNNIQQEQQQQQLGIEKLKSFITIMDSMTEKELDDSKLLNASRISRIARGSGTKVEQVNEVMAQYKIIKDFSTPRPNKNFNTRNIGNLLPPNLMRQLGGQNGIQNMMKQMSNGNMKLPEGFG